MFTWICLICIVVLVFKVMWFLSMSTLSELYESKPTGRKAKRKAVQTAMGYTYAATGTYGNGGYTSDYYIEKRRGM
ncbi:hypothetical protein [Peptoclostridium acidaminophilum]|uniref:hypothetical protein n=1 Tax=Peptoclostridium acidaminophilum TaxID=1731 RepID=UPI00046D7E7E|nr:hypothetical protein [Peptoclostridium acidaminophilum]